MPSDGLISLSAFSTSAHSSYYLDFVICCFCPKQANTKASKPMFKLFQMLTVTPLLLSSIPLEVSTDGYWMYTTKVLDENLSEYIDQFPKAVNNQLAPAYIKSIKLSPVYPPLKDKQLSFSDFNKELIPVIPLGVTSSNLWPHSLRNPTATSTESLVGVSRSKVSISKERTSCACSEK